MYSLNLRRMKISDINTDQVAVGSTKVLNVLIKSAGG